MAARKPTPVEVYYFPRRAKRPGSSQTIPELRVQAGVDLVSEAEPALLAQSPRSKPRGRKRRRDERRVTPTIGTEKPPEVSDMGALGHELFSLGRVNEARVVFEGMLVANPADSFALTMLGTIHLALQDLDKALVAFERALEIDPDDVPARVYRGELRLKRRKAKGAVEDFNRALQVAPADDPFAERARRLLKLARGGSKP